MRLILLHVCLFTIACIFSLSGCEEYEMPPFAVYPSGAIIGPDGPEPMRGWDSVTKHGRLEYGNYYNTGGTWYASVEIDILIYTEYTQLYLNRDAAELGNQGWFLTRNFSVSDRFLYIPDPERAYFAWDYVVFIYLDYVPESE